MAGELLPRGIVFYPMPEGWRDRFQTNFLQGCIEETEQRCGATLNSENYSEAEAACQEAFSRLEGTGLMNRFLAGSGLSSSLIPGTAEGMGRINLFNKFPNRDLFCQRIFGPEWVPQTKEEPREEPRSKPVELHISDPTPIPTPGPTFWQTLTLGAVFAALGAMALRVSNAASGAAFLFFQPPTPPTA